MHISKIPKDSGSAEQADQPTTKKKRHVNLRARIQIDPGVSDGCLAAESIFA